MPDLSSVLLGWPGAVVLLVVVWVVGRWEARCYERRVQRLLDDVAMRRRLWMRQLCAEALGDPRLLELFDDEDFDVDP